MKLGIMQPYFFPYLGYFHIINQADRWVVFDTAQYIRRGWVNRNRVLHPSEGWQYVTAPVKKHPREAAIRDVRVTSERDWRRRLLAQLEHYRKRAPHYDSTVGLVRDAVAGPEDESIAALDVRALDRVCARLGVHFEPEVFSRMDLELGPVEGPGDWALRISEALGASEYINPPGGAELFDEAAFERSGIRLTLSGLPPLEYDVRGYEWEPNLSIIDVLMWNEPERVKAHLDLHAGRGDDAAAG